MHDVWPATVRGGGGVANQDVVCHKKEEDAERLAEDEETTIC